MPQGSSTSAPRSRTGLRARLAALTRPRPPGLRLLPVARLATGARVPTEAAIRAMAGATPVAGNLLLCRVLGRYKMLAEAGDLTLAPHLALDGFWEWWTTSFLARTLRPGESVVDAGACTGYFTLLAAELVGPAGRVLALEPNPQSAALLRRNVALNGFADRVTVEEAALAPSGGRLLRLVVPPNSPMDAQLLKQDLAPGAGPRPLDGRATLLVRGRTLDELPGLQPDLVRLDVGEALEAAWDGMQRLLEERPAMRLLVVFDPARVAQPAAFLDRVAARFPLRRLDPEGRPRDCAPAELLAGGTTTLWLARDRAG
ncbi:FkbM family methyltransferase [Paracraurococcus lichenis]|uniref:FkbM family methyltransferase n=1 Tax=Paracraurococcus lichenis TaxID=3064888 RepID=A0ABT9E7A8_9PROT|nr:FkbM family methyltransferase [Paracraurococcus sp. LOR1-02]MDO9712053.1 FkbM family methyltransferase [Paracraurococcus sp. LOR1-02]